MLAAVSQGYRKTRADGCAQGAKSAQQNKKIRRATPMVMGQGEKSVGAFCQNLEIPPVFIRDRLMLRGLSAGKTQGTAAKKRDIGKKQPTYAISMSVRGREKLCI